MRNLGLSRLARKGGPYPGSDARLNGTERAFTGLLAGHAGEPVTVGGYTPVDGTKCSYLAC